MNKKNPYGLGATRQNNKVFLFYKIPSEKNNNFQIDSSSDGFAFRIFEKNAKIIKGNRQAENIKNCFDFRISQKEDLFFLTYILRVEKQSFLCAAHSQDLITWKKIGQLSDINQAGMLVPNFKHKENFILYSGGKSIKTAQSEDCKNWHLLSNSPFELPEDLTDNYWIKIADVFLTDEGIVLIYYLYKSKDGQSGYSGNWSIRALLFDKNDPFKVLWHADKIIWAKSKEWQEQQTRAIGLVKKDEELISYWQTKEGKIFSLGHPHFQSALRESKQLFFFPLLKKFKDNPILKPVVDHFWESKAVFNPAAVHEQEKIHLIYRAVGDDDVSVLGYAWSKDGVCIEGRSDEPIYTPRKPFEGKSKKKAARGRCSFIYRSGWGGCGGCEDPRITKIGNRFYMTYVAYDGQNPPRVALTSIGVDDFLNQQWNWDEPVLISRPGVVDKNACIFPEKINDKYVIFHRVYPNILIDFVDSLDFDGKTWLKGEYAITPRKGYWDSRKVGVGPTPIKTDDGWLVIYHGVDDNDDARYQMGAMLLDQNDPTKILHRSSTPILKPTENYENEGFKYGVAYPCGAVLKDDRLFVYYGGADAVVCGANAPLTKFLSQLKYSSVPKLTPL